MTNDLIPASVGRAALRGFIRTTCQAYAASIPTALSVGAIGDALNSTPKLITTAAVGILSPLLAGAASFFSILGNGVPNDYQIPPADEGENV